ncbi:MAG: AtpZ/AtpI family protein [Chloroflexota bacterium]|nr:AtpZ/AtpI family protein [Chloroflexota bacterium]
MGNQPDHDRRQQVNTIGLVAGFAWSIVVSLLVCIGGGIFLDQQLDTTPLLTLIGVALGLFAAGYQLYELTLIGRTDRPSGPIGRRLEQRAAARGSTRRGNSDAP